MVNDQNEGDASESAGEGRAGEPLELAPPTTVFECESSRRLVVLLLQKGGKPEFEGRLLEDLDLSNLDFSNMTLQAARLRNSSLANSSLDKTNLRSADLRCCNLTGPRFPS